MVVFEDPELLEVRRVGVTELVGFELGEQPRGRVRPAGQVGGEQQAPHRVVGAGSARYLAVPPSRPFEARSVRGTVRESLQRRSPSVIEACGELVAIRRVKMALSRDKGRGTTPAWLVRTVTWSWPGATISDEGCTIAPRSPAHVRAPTCGAKAAVGNIREQEQRVRPGGVVRADHDTGHFVGQRQKSCSPRPAARTTSSVARAAELPWRAPRSSSDRVSRASRPASRAGTAGRHRPARGTRVR